MSDPTINKFEENIPIREGGLYYFYHFILFFLFPFFPFSVFFPGTDSSTILWMSTLVLGIKEFNKYFMENIGENGGDFYGMVVVWGEMGEIPQ